MRVLVLGGGGQIARAVEAAAPARHDTLIKTRAQLDIGDAEVVARALKEFQPSWVVNGAAYTSVDLAEDRPQQAMAANDIAVGILANAVAQAGARLLHLSTDFVFDGRSSRAYLPGDPPNPLSVYGLSKLGGERHVLSAPGGGIVLRTAWVYASQGRNFVLTMLKLMREKPEIRVVCDQIGAPTWAASAAAALWGLIEADAPGGIHHWTDLGVASWYDFAVAVQEEAQLKGLLDRSIPVVPIRSVEYPTRAQRPAFSLLDTGSTRALLKVPAHHWRHNLRSMLDELRAA
ncbi:MAG: dTDP-4-dehydrorhamnose reductase [Steroidobacteraceae bacterium]